MGWLKELADLSADKVPLQKSSFRDIYFSASRALHRLDKNWELGEYNLSKINLSSDDYIFSLLVDVDKIVCGLFDKTIKFWDRKTLQCYRTLECPDFMWCLKWNSEVLVASFQNEFELNVWDIRSGNLLNAFENPLEHQVDRLALHKHALATLSIGTSEVAVWDISNPTNITLIQVLESHFTNCRGRYEFIEMDENHIACSSVGGAIHLWRASTYEYIGTVHQLPVDCGKHIMFLAYRYPL